MKKLIHISEYTGEINTDIAWTQGVSELINSLYYPCDTFIKCGDSNDFMQSYSILKNEDIKIDVVCYSKSSSSKKEFLFFCMDFENLKRFNISEIQYHKQSDDVKPPNKVFALSENKIKDWISYYKYMYNKIKLIDDKREAFVSDFLLNVENSGCDIHWSIRDISGYIETDLLYYKFNIRKSGYIEQKIEVKNNDLETFLKIK